MGIQDRAYYRDKPPPGAASSLGRTRAWSVNTWLIVINIAVFVLQIVLTTVRVPVYQGANYFVSELPGTLRVTQDYFVGDRPVPSLRDVNPGALVTRRLIDGETGQLVGVQRYAIMDPLTAFGHFSTGKGAFAVDHRGVVLGLEVWRLVTFQFLHANIIHIFFNMFGLFIFGSMVERFLGSKRYLAFYLVCGIFGGVTYLLLNLAGQVFTGMPGLLPNSPYTPLVGASAGVFGVILAGAYIAPNAMLQLLIPPVPIKLKWFAYGYVALAALSLFTGSANAGGEAAHIGGAVAGAFFIRRSHLLRDFFDVLGDSRKSGATGDTRDIDEILAKVSKDGLGSLSKRERERLRKASGR